MTLDVDVRFAQGAFSLEAAFASSGRLTALFGASGSGKTTLVNLIGGLLRPSRGRIAVDGRVLVDTAAGVFVPAHKRRIGYVFQDARLFPHLSVASNLGYGRFFAPAGERAANVDQVVDLLGIRPLLGRRPGHLSGGERSRVAIGRALLASPKLILMDEPLASLDEARKAEILPYIERLRDEVGIPVVYVSHALTEVSRLATDVVVLEGGRVLATGTAGTVLAAPDAMPVGERGEAGSLVELQLVEQERAYGLSVLRSSGGEWRLPLVELPVGSQLRVRVRARDVMIATEPVSGISALNVLAGKIEAITGDGETFGGESGQRQGEASKRIEGPDVMVTVACGDDRLMARVTRLSVERLGLKPGLPVYAVVKAVTFDRGNPASAAPLDRLKSPMA